MSGAAIRVEGLGKMYRIGGPVERYKTLRDTVSQAVTGIGQRVRGLFGGENGAGRKYETIWALKDVSFEVQPGEVVGIIGRNGAGKSTLLKILSRITEPTEGRVEIRGRVGSLLEVGTGFHPELTGRENVYLNGAILGMTRAEVDRKFDEIVAFAEVEKFIDTPVKHYSSGMYLRLGFSVAAHLEPDILLIDEVLAVGDLDYQRKCVGKMKDVSRAGRSVLFVSHNMTAVNGLCSAAMLLENGRLLMRGVAQEVVNIHKKSISVASSGFATSPQQRRGNHRIAITRLQILNHMGERSAVFATGDPIIVRICYDNPNNLASADFEIKFKDEFGSILSTLSTFLKGKSHNLRRGTGAVYCRIPQLTLAPGEYALETNCMVGRDVEDVIENAASITVLDGHYHGSYVRIKKEWHGPLVIAHEWDEIAQPPFS